MTFLTRLLWALIALALFCFALLAVNQSQIALRFLNWQTPELSVFWWLLAAFVLGILLASLGCMLVSVRARLRQRQLRKELEAAQRELEKLRNLTLQD